MTTPRPLNTVVGAIVPSKSVHYVLYIYYTYAKLIANSVQLVVNDEMQLPPTECGLGRLVQVQITKIWQQLADFSLSSMQCNLASIWSTFK